MDPREIILITREKLKVFLIYKLKAIAPIAPANIKQIALVAISTSEYPYGLIMKLQFEAKAINVP